jgi:solute:Na+ symporter, SSS family
MHRVDYLILALYLAGMVAAGAVFARGMRTARDMFAAGGRSPWWVSGLSGFMTMFSAGTFVVWGGIAFRHGLVAVMINLCYGVAALIVGAGLAARWRALGVSSAAEFLRLRFGDSIVQFYTWLQGTILVFALGGSIYALSVIVCALMPLPDGHVLALLADPATGHLSVTLLSVALCAVVILIAMSGGLWAVLVTDVLQFVILTVSVLFVVPLLLSRALADAGGWTALLARAPAPDFFRPIAGDYTGWFLTGWIVVHAFKIGGEWAYVQRFTCVPTPRDARKSAVLFGAMYLVSPLFWMIPPLLHRLMNPLPEGLDAGQIARLAEQAYILACTGVLPAGMVGLMVAAMASATASMATTGLNVYAGAFTTEFYVRRLRPDATDRQTVRAGRVFTLLLGALIIAGALIIPRVGYASYIIRITALLTVPLVAPTLWGLYSRKIGLKAVWSVTVLGFLAALLVQFGLSAGGWFAAWPALRSLAALVQSNQEVANLATGIVLPLLILGLLELLERRIHPGWTAVQEFSACTKQEAVSSGAAAPTASTLPVRMVGLTLAAIGVIMALLAAWTPGSRWIMLTFALIQGILAATLLWRVRKTPRTL